MCVVSANALGLRSLSSTQTQHEAAGGSGDYAAVLSLARASSLTTGLHNATSFPLAGAPLSLSLSLSLSLKKKALFFVCYFLNRKRRSALSKTRGLSEREDKTENRIKPEAARRSVQDDALLRDENDEQETNVCSSSRVRFQNQSAQDGKKRRDETKHEREREHKFSSFSLFSKYIAGANACFFFFPSRLRLREPSYKGMPENES